MSHTPGPWKVEREGEQSRYYITARNVSTGLLCPAVATLREDAYLIAAAPEMLATLEEWANCMPVLCDDPECPDCPRVRRTRELIAKAKGEE